MRQSFVKLAVMASFLAIGGLAGGAAQAQNNTCRFANDGDCDEPNGLNYCASGTDMTDCSNPASNYGSGRGFSAGIYGAPAPVACIHTNDGDCDEPNGLNLCPSGTDAVDCSNPASNFGRGPGFSAGVYAAPAAPTRPITPIPTAPTGGSIAAISSGAFVHGGGGGYSGCPNYNIGRTAFGQATMFAGQRQYRVPHITAGGRFPLTNCFPGTNWRGFTITRPDFRFFYQGSSPTGQLTFQLTSVIDSVLLINTPDGQWFFNDDSNGTFNSTLTFSPVLEGQYDIWTGAYNNTSNNQAQLVIFE